MIMNELVVGTVENGHFIPEISMLGRLVLIRLAMEVSATGALVPTDAVPLNVVF